MSESRLLARRAGLVLVGTFASRVLGLARDVVVAAVFSVASTDAFFIAYTIPNTLRMLLGEGAVSNAFVPVFTDVRTHQGEPAARRFLARFTVTLGGLLLLASLLGVLGAPWIALGYAGGLRDRPAEFALVVDLTRLLFPILFLAGIGALATGVLNVLGLKAYKCDDGSVNLFRPDANARRFHNSADRMAMAPLPESVFIEAVEQLVRTDRAWIPGGEGSLYLRPFMIASEVFLGVKPSADYIFAVIASPVGSYFKGGPAPVSIWVSETYTRAAIGGTGAVKCGGNYAASLRAQAEAIEHGCDQVVFLDAVERRNVEELGGMNVFFVFW